MEQGKRLISGLEIGGVFLTIYLVYKAINDYQNSQRIANIDQSLAKLAGTKAWDNKLIDAVTLKKETEELNKLINDKI